jgi:hypothetical protein
MEYIKKIFWILLYPLNYLFYKIFVFTRDYLTFGDYPIKNMSIMGLFLIINAYTISIGIFDILLPNWISVMIIMILLPYVSPKLSLKIVAIFSKESEKARIIGNIIVITYIILSVVLGIKIISPK